MSNHIASKYKTNVIKSGNSFAIRVPKDYADTQGLSLGQDVEVEVTPIINFQLFDAGKAQRTLDTLLEIVSEPFRELKTIEDIVEWQREIRKDRPLLGRDYDYDQEA